MFMLRTVVSTLTSLTSQVCAHLVFAATCASSFCARAPCIAISWCTASLARRAWRCRGAQRVVAALPLPPPKRKPAPRRQWHERRGYRQRHCGARSALTNSAQSSSSSTRRRRRRQELAGAAIDSRRTHAARGPMAPHPLQSLGSGGRRSCAGRVWSSATYEPRPGCRRRARRTRRVGRLCSSMHATSSLPTYAPSSAI